jgi:hypothetical protein
MEDSLSNAESHRSRLAFVCDYTYSTLEQTIGESTAQAYWRVAGLDVAYVLLPSFTLYFGPRTALAGLMRKAWPTAS